MNIYINKSESEAISNGWEYVNNLLENCTADETTDEGKRTMKLLYDTLDGLRSLEVKLAKARKGRP